MIEHPCPLLDIHCNSQSLLMRASIVTGLSQKVCRVVWSIGPACDSPSLAVGRTCNARNSGSTAGTWSGPKWISGRGR